MRLVLDTNIVVSALFWDGAPSRLLETCLARDAEFYASPWLLDELAKTLNKDKLALKVANSGLSADQWLTKYAALCGTVEPVAMAHRIAPDPDDDWVIATALAAGADLIVTGDKPFLSVGAVGSLRIVGVAEALEILGRV